MKKYILKVVVFLVAWAIIYFISDNNFAAVSFFIAILFVNSINKDALILLANEFDHNHNNLANVVNDLKDRMELLEDENEKMKFEIDQITRKIDRE
ncbi:hypothetical protein [Acinetobacter lactucae]|uniref:BZIP transcription factor n=1 Tax=Acinetobacter lactucae TaxID=1785128 RepID=A0AB35K4B2_9GAMM|nr:hypothetical protein [Acinetobacter lactucae]MDD9317197.1 hypothetical protein [Acinetobacter lactucae]MDD9321326.1 hypothetical protein [Acinetobacter lactucae]